MGYTYVELDVQLSKDGVPVILHDYTVDRVSDHSGSVKDFTLAELKQMKIGTNETIPTLEETMNLLRGKLNVMVELKQAGDLYPGLEQKVLDVIRKIDTFDQSIIISFDHFSILKLRGLSADVRLGLTSSCSMPYVFPFLREMKCELLGVPFKMLTDEYVNLIIEQGVEVGPWPVDTWEDMEVIAKKYPATLITTNELERWADFYKSHDEIKRA